jgi:NAD(P)-dependent dehydrogenase (short-subunit alcohol dehydrogenase family)
LADFGQSVTLVRQVDSEEYRHAEGMIHADLTSPQAVQHTVELVRRSAGRIAGLIHVLPLASSAAGDDVDSRAAWVCTKSLYLLTQALRGDLTESARSGSAFVLAATGMGGSLGYGRDARQPSFAAAGGVVGFAKCLALELPDVRVRLVDMNPSHATGDNVDLLLSELGDADGPVEVGNDGQRRVTWEPVPAELDLSGPPQIALNSSSVVVLTGGARGITARIAAELGRRFQPRLVLVGRASLVEREAEETRNVKTGDLKSVLIAMHTARGQQADPRAIEQAYQQLLKDRELRENVQAIRAAGAEVEYLAADMRDATAVQQLIEGVVARHGRLDGVIHAAGVIEDKLIADKTVASFDRVFSTKVDSAIHLARLLPQKSLKFVALFSSIASRFGNRGQSDYAAANEFLTKLAVEWDSRCPARVFSVAWGPWSQVGMVAELAPYLEARGLTLIPPDVGARMFVDEVVYGRKGDSEIIIAGGAEKLVTSAISASRSA